MINKDVKFENMLDGGNGVSGYWDSESGTMGVNLANGEGENGYDENGEAKLKSAKEIEQTRGHEMIHAMDDGSISKNASREMVANLGGTTAGMLSTLNNWSYGDGGLNTLNINNYVNANQNQLMLNSAIFNTNYKTNPNRFEKENYLVSRPLDHWTGIVAHHNFILITGNKQYVDDIIKDKRMVGYFPEPVVSKELNDDLKDKLHNNKDTHYVILGGYTADGKTLIKDVNNYSDERYVDTNDVDVVKINFKNDDTYTNDRNVINVYNSYNQQAPYSPYGNETDEYNSNSFARTLCSYSGGLNCGHDFPLSISPRDNQIIPKKYFNNLK
jgi:hypothetical protein